MNYGNPFFITIRYFLSFLGILKILKMIIGIFNKEYEKKYSKELLRNIDDNFHIWDVGSNKGIYTKKFLKVNNVNSVVAFEPTPHLCKLLKSKFSIAYNLSVLSDFSSSYNLSGNNNNGIDSYFLHYADGIPYEDLLIYDNVTRMNLFYRYQYSYVSYVGLDLLFFYYIQFHLSYQILRK